MVGHPSSRERLRASKRDVTALFAPKPLRACQSQAVAHVCTASPPRALRTALCWLCTLTTGNGACARGTRERLAQHLCALLGSQQCSGCHPARSETCRRSQTCVVAAGTMVRVLSLLLARRGRLHGTGTSTSPAHATSLFGGKKEGGGGKRNVPGSKLVWGQKRGGGGRRARRSPASWTSSRRPRRSPRSRRSCKPSTLGGVRAAPSVCSTAPRRCRRRDVSHRCSQRRLAAAEFEGASADGP